MLSPLEGFSPQELAPKVSQRALRPWVSPGSPASADDGWDWGPFDLPLHSLKGLERWVWLPRQEEELPSDSDVRDLLNHQAPGADRRRSGAH